ncbi:hypothetical protein S245_012613, partial [Arachis hypogaea]
GKGGFVVVTVGKCDAEKLCASDSERHHRRGGVERRHRGCDGGMVVVKLGFRIGKGENKSSLKLRGDVIVHREDDNESNVAHDRISVMCESDEPNLSFPLPFIFSPPLSSMLLFYRHCSSPPPFISAGVHLVATAQLQATVSNVIVVATFGRGSSFIVAVRLLIALHLLVVIHLLTTWSFCDPIFFFDLRVCFLFTTFYLLAAASNAVVALPGRASEIWFFGFNLHIQSGSLAAAKLLLLPLTKLGEEQKKLNVLSNKVFVNALISSGRAVKELEDAVFVKPKQYGKYIVVFYPLDGSSNIESGVFIGAIFGIYAAKDKDNVTLDDVLQLGNKMLAVGYYMYGSSCMVNQNTNLMNHSFWI